MPRHRRYIVLLIISIGNYLAAQTILNNSTPCENPPNLINAFQSLESQMYADVVSTIEEKCIEIIEEYKVNAFIVYQNLGDVFFDQEKYNKAIEYYQKAEQVLQRYNYPDPEKYGKLISSLSAAHIKLGQFGISEELVDNALNRLVNYKNELPVVAELLYKKGTLLFHSDDMDLSLVYFDSSLVVLNSYPDTLQDYSINLHKGYSAYYKKLNKFTDARYHDSIFLKATIVHYGDSHSKSADAYNRVARTIEELGDLNEAEGLYEQALKIYTSLNEESSQLADTYENLAYIDYKKADFISAGRLFLRVHEVRTKVYGFDHYRTLDALSMLSLSYFQSGDLATSDSLNTILLDKYDNIFPPHHRSILNLLIRNSLIKHGRGFSQEGLDILHEAERRCLQLSGEAHPYMTYIYANLGTIANAVGFYSKAKNYHIKALKYYLRDLDEGNPRISMVHKNLASDLVHLGEYSLAEDHLVKAIQNLKFNALGKDLAELFPIERVEILKTYCRLDFARYLKNQKPSDLEAILKHGDQVLKLLNGLRSSISDHDSQIKLRQNLNEVFELQLYAFLILNDLHGIDCQKDIYALIEQSKNYDLHLQFLKEISSSKLMDDTMINDYNRLQRRKQKILVNIGELKNEKDNSLNLAQTIDSLSILEAQIQSIYPGYFLRPQNESLDIDQLISSTSDSMCLVNMYRGDSVIYISILTNKGIRSLKIENFLHLDSTVNSLVEAITTYHQTLNPTRELFDSMNAQYILSGHEIYVQLIAPILKELSTEINHLVFLTDDILSFIPFEILLSESPLDHGYKSYPYLLKDYNISYSYLSSDLSASHINSDRSTKFTGFAPSFLSATTLTSDTRSYSFSELKHNINEVEMLQSYGASTYINEKATKQNLIKILNEASIIHLATHGNGNVSEGEESYIAMSHNEDITEALFFSKEFYDHPMTAELVVLSACETGFGELKKNEGVISLGRGVMHAGASSVISSLWNVNDNTTIDLFKSFYINLDQGKSKAQALHLAKLDFIEKAPTEISAHPFYWAPFIIHGNIDPVTLPTSRFNLIFPLLGLLLVILLILISKKVSKR